MANSTRNKSDSFTLRAKELGYPARSVFKLEEIQKKFHIMTNRNGTVLDIGAAPGSWTLWICRNFLSPEGKIVSCDLNPLRLTPLPSQVKEYTGDAFSDQAQQFFQTFAPFDTIVSDCAPQTTGIKLLDTQNSLEIVSGVLTCALKWLKPGGNLTAKIYQGGDVKQILKKAQSMFKSAQTFKPNASRSDSFETFIVCKGLKGN